MQLNKKIVLFFFFLFLSTTASAIILPIVQGLVTAARAIPVLYRGATTAEKVSAGASVAIHAGIFAIAFGGDQADTSVQTPLTVHLKPNVPTSLPAGWTNPNGLQQPTPPSNIGAPPIKLMASDNSGFEFTDIPTGCIAKQGSTLGTYIGFLDTGSSVYCRYQTSPGNVNQVKKADYIPVCPTGYGLSGSAPNQTCALVNAQIVMKPADSKCEILVINNTFQLDTRDPDCTNPELAAQGIERLDNKVTVQIPNQKHEVTLNPDGSIKHKTTTKTNDGKTIIDERNISSTGDVTGEKSSVHDGQGDLMNPTPNTTTPVSGNITAKIDFPTDYNREATQQAIKTDTADIKKNTKDTFDEIKKQFESTPEESVNTSEHEFDNTKYGGIRDKEGDYIGIVSTLVGKLGIPSGGQCSNASINAVMFGVSTSWDFQPICISLAPLINYLFWTLILIFVWREVGSMRGSA